MPTIPESRLRCSLLHRQSNLKLLGYSRIPTLLDARVHLRLALNNEKPSPAVRIRGIKDD